MADKDSFICRVSIELIYNFKLANLQSISDKNKNFEVGYIN